jgi:VanZ family protein
VTTTGHRLAWGLVLLWMAVIFVLSAQPDLIPERIGPGSFRFSIEKLGHVTVYSVLGFLVIRALTISRVNRAGWWAFVAVFLYAISDELHQGLVPGRDPSLVDVAIDVISATIVVVVFLRFSARGRSGDVFGGPA